MWRFALVLMVACGKGDEPRKSAPVPRPVPIDAAPAGPPQLRLVGCGAAPEMPLMRIGDPDVPGSVYGYHTGAPADTPYTRQPFGLPQQALAKPYIWASPSSGDEKLGDQLEAALKPHEDKLLACYAKALADQTESQHEMNVMWNGRKVEVTLRTDIVNPHLDAEATECVAAILRTVKLPPKVLRAASDTVVSLHASRLQAVKQPPKKVKKKPLEDGEMEGGFGFGVSGPGPGGHGTRAHKDGWSGYRLFGPHDDGAALAPVAVATITPKLPAIETCLRALTPSPLTGSLRAVVDMHSYVGTPSLVARVAGLGDLGSMSCFWNALRDIPLVGSVPQSDATKRLVCDFTWGEAQPLRATIEEFDDVMRVHATDIEYFGIRYTPEDDLPYRRYPLDSILVIADPDAPGAFINAALDFGAGVDNIMLAVQADSGPPVFVGRAAQASFTIVPGAHVGFQQAAGNLTRCDDACKTHTPCAGAWVGIGDDNVGRDLLALRAAAEKAGYASVTVGRRACK